MRSRSDRRVLLRPRYWVFVLRYLWVFKLRSRHIATSGFVFLDRGSEIYCRRGLGHLEIGRFVWVGRGTAIRCHEGFMRIGDKAVFGQNDHVNCYLDVEIGRECIVGDWVYVGDFDHRFDDPSLPIRKQGIVATPVQVGADCWIGEKASVLRGVTVGRGSVIGAHAVVTRDLPAGSVAAGVPARVIKRRGIPE